jgi:hypothetical protein
MAALDSKSFDEPDELLELPFFTSRIVTLGEVHVASMSERREDMQNARNA